MCFAPTVGQNAVTLVGILVLAYNLILSPLDRFCMLIKSVLPPSHL
jgi:hypothetical protein